MRRISVILFFLLITTMLHASEMLPKSEFVTGAVIKPRTEMKVYHINNRAENASDENPGTEEKPFKTLRKMQTMIIENAKKNIGTHAIIHPGVFHEAISLLPLKIRKYYYGPTVIIEAKEKGTVIITGAKVVKELLPVEGDKRLVAVKWPYKWSKIRNKTFDSWKRWGITIKDIMHRRELLAVDGKVLRQWLTKEEMTQGSYFVDEKENRILIWPAKNCQIEKAKVEVGLIGNLIRIKGWSNLVLRGLTVQHSITYGIDLRDCENILVEDCITRWNNTDGGPAIWTGKNITFRRNKSISNGNSGISVRIVRNLVFDENEALYNNWRGDWGEFYGFEICGMKQMQIRDALYRNNRSIGNLTGGFWFDNDNCNIFVEGGLYAYNKTYGLHLEYNSGPIVLKDNIFAFNGMNGIWADHSEQVYLRGNIFYNNKPAQLRISGTKSRKLYVQYRGIYGDNIRPPLKLRNWSIQNNIFVASGKNLLFQSAYADLEVFLKTLISNDNYWYHSDLQEPIQLSGIELNLKKWQALSGQDLGSKFQKIEFKDPENLDFTIITKGLMSISAKEKERDADFKIRFKQFGEEKWNDIKKKLKIPYAYIAEQKDPKWTSLDISPFVNRGLTGKGAWIGYELLFFPPGKKIIHGVPFTILDQKKHNNHAVIALHSQKLKFLKIKLPDTPVRIPVNNKFKALYFLHGAAYAVKHVEAAKYTIVYADGSKVTQPIVVFGAHSQLKIPDGQLLQALKEKSNIQDWWPSFEPIRSKHARPVEIINPEKPLGYFRYIYSLEWINPHPEKEIKEITLQGNPKLDTIIFVFAISGLN